MKPIYLLTGAAGLLGNNIAIALSKKKNSVRALVLKDDPGAKHLPRNVEIFTGDITDTASLEEFFNVPEQSEITVIHCASIVSLSPEPSQKVFDVNVTGTQNIVDLCVAKKVKKLVYVSSTGAICELPHGEVITAPDSFLPDEVVGYYSKTKALATQYVLKAVEERNLDASIVYPSGICGPNDYAFGPVTQFILQYCDGKMPVGFEGTFNSVDVRDLAEGVISCAERGRKGEGYIMSNEMVSIRRMFRLISSASGAPLVETILTADEMLASSSAKIPDSPEKEKQISTLKFSLYNMTRNNNFSSQKAVEELDYRTRPFDETITDEVQWLIKIGKIAPLKKAKKRPFSSLSTAMML